MVYCSKCGAPSSDDAHFCSKCGSALASNASVPNTNRQNAPAAPFVAPEAPSFAPAAPAFASAAPAAQGYAPAAQGYAPAAQGYAPAKDFSGVTVRYCCPNKHVFDAGEHITSCPTCGAPIPDGGYIQLYRMGNPMGCAVGMGIYVNDVPCGHIANKQSLRIKVPFGNHKIHVTHTTTRKCNDPVITVTPQQPHVFYKAHFSKAGFAITVEPATPDEMPLA